MKVLVLLSGGMDSCTTLTWAIKYQGIDNVAALNMYYGQRHEREIASARTIAGYYDIPFYSKDLSSVFEDIDSAMLKNGKEVEDGSYEEQLTKHDEPTTAVPFRNGIFISVAAAIAKQKGYDAIAIGVHQGDEYANYFDCSEPFILAMKTAISEGTGGDIKLFAPFADKTKADVVRYACSNASPIGLTWSCYKGGDKPCGTCATCIERAKAFEEVGVEDPVNYGKKVIYITSKNS